MSTDLCAYYEVWAMRLVVLLVVMALGMCVAFPLLVWCSYKSNSTVIPRQPNANNSPSIPALRGLRS